MPVPDSVAILLVEALGDEPTPQLIELARAVRDTFNHEEESPSHKELVSPIKAVTERLS